MWTPTLRAGGKQLHARLLSLDGHRVSLSDAEGRLRRPRRAWSRSGFVIRSVKRGEKRKHPAPPFTTSNLQQEASRKLGFTTAKTMQIAQQLYEGVDIEGRGTLGLISYIRTDSVRLSDEAVAAAREAIRRVSARNTCRKRRTCTRAARPRRTRTRQYVRPTLICARRDKGIADARPV